jgi:hypothetical protein
MSAVLDDTDLDWVTFIDTDIEKCCERQIVECPNVAVYRVKWGPSREVMPALQDHCRNTSLLCLTCYTHLVEGEGWIACGHCARRGMTLFKEAVYVEFIR